MKPTFTSAAILQRGVHLVTGTSATAASARPLLQRVSRYAEALREPTLSLISSREMRPDASDAAILGYN
ncbi:hypothetical protein [Paraburkholderia sp. MM5482-R1]|uniref:hypothetical protein n=1 Tax=unclassified Paraburkholderia TaxID=2615204 RepID=UPI003D1C81FF